MGLYEALFGSYSKRALKTIRPIADKVLALEEKYDIEIDLLGILPTIVEKTALTDYYLNLAFVSRDEEENPEAARLAAPYGDKLFKTAIRKGNIVNESTIERFFNDILGMDKGSYYGSLFGHTIRISDLPGVRLDMYVDDNHIFILYGDVYQGLDPKFEVPTFDKDW